MYERCWYVWYPYDPYGICIFTCMIVLEIVVACCDCDVAFNKFIEWAWSIWLFAWSIQLLRSFNGMTSLPCAATAEDIAQSERNWSPTRKRVGYQRPQEGQSKLEELTDYRNQEVIWGAMRYHEVLVFLIFDMFGAIFRFMGDLMWLSMKIHSMDVQISCGCMRRQLDAWLDLMIHLCINLSVSLWWSWQYHGNGLPGVLSRKGSGKKRLNLLQCHSNGHLVIFSSASLYATGEPPSVFLKRCTRRRRHRKPQMCHQLQSNRPKGSLHGVHVQRGAKVRCMQLHQHASAGLGMLQIKDTSFCIHLYIMHSYTYIYHIFEPFCIIVQFVLSRHDWSMGSVL